LRAARLAAGLSQTALAIKAGLKSQGAVSNIEVDERKQPAADTLLQLARALGVRPYWLLYGKGPMEEVPPAPAPAAPGSAFRSKYSPVGLELLDLFERIQDEELKERLYAQFQSEINAVLQGLPSQLAEYKPYERDGAPTPEPPAPTRKQPGKRQAAPSEDSTPSPAASRRRAR
jgi:transcriptional regulator with XRE-family HTH domain